jgi:NTP pyrophosphatase (non-canonical NTP hydrolase)
MNIEEKLKEYQLQAMRTCVDLGNYKNNKLHMKMGVITEIGEIIDIFKKNLAYGKPIDIVNLGEEIADVQWYLSNFATLSDSELDLSHFNEDYQLLTELDVFNLLFEIVTEPLEYSLNTFNLIHIAKYYNLDYAKLLDNNIAKLKVRFPEKFTEEAALNRNLEEERKTLEQ